MPTLKEYLVENSNLKPGFDLMYKNFKLFSSKQECNYCSFNDALITLNKCRELIDSEISKQIEFL